MAIDPEHKQQLVVEMKARVLARDEEVSAWKKIMREMWPDGIDGEGISFKHFVDSIEARLFQIMVCTDMLMLHASEQVHKESSISIEFLQWLVENVDTLHAAWLKDRAATLPAAGDSLTDDWPDLLEGFERF